LGEQRHGRVAPDLAHVELHERDYPARPDVARQPRQRADRIGEVGQHEPPHERVEACPGRVVVEVAMFDARLQMACRCDAGVRQRDRLLRPLDAEDRAVRPHKPPDEHRDVAGAAADLEHLLPCPDPGVQEQRLGFRFDERGLPPEPSELSSTPAPARWLPPPARRDLAFESTPTGGQVSSVRCVPRGARGG
jgi:hypothetical protein